MNQPTNPAPTPADTPPSRPVQGEATEYRCLQVNVPRRLFDLAKAKALMEGSPWPGFVVELLRDATAELAKGTPGGPVAAD